MANSIVLKAKAISTLDEYLVFSVALALNDRTKDIPATFSITSEGANLPMIGITEYGKLVGLATADTPAFTVKATPLDGSAATETNITVAIIIETGVGHSIGNTQ